MKEFLKYAGLLIVALFIAVIVYPLLHETGHAVLCVLFGAKIIEFNLLPTPCVLCEMSSVNKLDALFIGLGGMYFPLLICCIIKPKTFWLWYSVQITKIICMMSYFVSFISLTLYLFGVVVANEDIIKIISLYSNSTLIFLFVLAFSIFGTLYSIIKQKPLIKLLNYFDIPPTAFIN